MDTSENKIKIPPPKFHDFTIYEASTRLSLPGVWEIGVPAQHSLPWSIVLSYLYLSSDSDFKAFLQKLTGDDMEVNEIKKKKKLGSKPLDIYGIKQQLKSFNPFKNRHAFFHQAKEVTEVFRIFDLRLNRYANKLKKMNDEWNDDFKLNAASHFLECEIEVHFPDQKIVIYPKTLHTFKSKIVLFQHENMQHGSRLENINVFRFGMLYQQTISFKIDALNHFLKKAKISNESISKVKELVKNSETHGKYFLKTILESDLGQECCEILQKMYRSPYIALRISEAGFETDPLTCSTEKLSVFCQSVIFGKDSKCLSILYDYASNCQYLFDHSVRRASDNVLVSLGKIKSLLEKDVSELSNNVHSKGPDTSQRCLNILNQFITYSEYQINVASDLNNLKKSFEQQLPTTRTKEVDFQFRKSVIKSILTHYQNYFYCDLNRQLLPSMSISDKFPNYLRFSEYYKNTDSFGCISFFDNFYQLRILIGLKRENFFSSIEWKMFVVILLNDYFPEYAHETEDNLTFDEKTFEKVNILRYVPLLHRNVLQTEILTFLKVLKNASEIETLQKSLIPATDSNHLPMVKDELLRIRLDIHIQAALEVSPGDDSFKSVLAIERALQVIGESLKPPASNNGVISFLLRSCLSLSLQKHLINIRNDLSHQRCNSAYGRSTIEQDLDYFRKIQIEIAQIKRRFEIVFFTQFLRIEESAMFNCIKEIGHELGQDIRETFYDKYVLMVDERVKNYEKHHGKCVALLFDSLFDLQNHIGKANEDELMAHLKAIQYLLHFISRHTTSVTVLNNLKTAVDFFVLDSESKELLEDDLCDFLSKWINVLKVNNIIGQTPLSVTFIESFYNQLKSDLFSTDEEVEIKSALLCAYEEATDARSNLKDLFKCNANEPKALETWLKRIFIPTDIIVSVRDCFNSKLFKKALGLVKNERFSKEHLQKDTEEMFQTKDGPSPFFTVLLTKITYQKYLSSPIYTSVKLSDHILKKLEFFLTKTVHFLIARIKSLKDILFEDEEIQKTCVWGKSAEIKNHLKFLMRQRYLKEVTVRASLDMAFFDCVNILHKQTSLSDLYEKSTDLFSGIDLRNMLAHRTNIPETIGGILAEDDFPSTMIEKMLELIDDLDAVESTLALLPKVGILEERNFVNWLKNNSEEKYKKQVNAINKCKRWENYLFLFPFIRN